MMGSQQRNFCNVIGVIVVSALTTADMIEALEETGRYRVLDIYRQTGFLLPPSVDEWLPEKHLARFVVEVIDGLDLRVMRGSYRGSGSASYPPLLLLGILVYGYATGVFSSRKLERATYERMLSWIYLTF